MAASGGNQAYIRQWCLSVCGCVQEVVGIEVIDGVLEDITLGLEVNTCLYSQWIIG